MVVLRVYVLASGLGEEEYDESKSYTWGEFSRRKKCRDSTGGGGSGDRGKRSDRKKRETVSSPNVALPLGCLRGLN